MTREEIVFNVQEITKTISNYIAFPFTIDGSDEFKHLSNENLKHSFLKFRLVNLTNSKYNCEIFISVDDMLDMEKLTYCLTSGIEHNKSKIDSL